MRRYDYIIAGTGCAGLSLAVHLIDSGLFKHKNILLADRSQKSENDRTWCFWENTAGLFEPVVSKRWQHLVVYGRSFKKEENISPYVYKMIRSADFYNYCKEMISRYPEFEWQYGEIANLKGNAAGASLSINGEEIEAGYIFSSIVPRNPNQKRNEYFLLQHFQGYYIETELPEFDENTATLMDFRIEQELDTAFVYVLPLNSNKALIEFTVFSREGYEDEQYHSEISNYISEKLRIGNYKILEVEKGVIPMTNRSFQVTEGRLIYIGIAGGAAKPSSGYTFQFIQATCRTLIDSMLKSGTFIASRPHHGRFVFYDSLLLQLLSEHTIAGRDIFERLFLKNRVADILSFLEDKSSLLQELKIISSLQKWIFFKAAIKYLLAGSKTTFRK